MEVMRVPSEALRNKLLLRAGILTVSLLTISSQVQLFNYVFVEKHAALLYLVVPLSVLYTHEPSPFLAPGDH